MWQIGQLWKGEFQPQRWTALEIVFNWQGAPSKTIQKKTVSS